MVGRLSVVIVSTVAILFAGAMVALYPMPARAVGSAADAICFEPGMCPYGTRCGQNGPPGVVGKPCSDNTNGFVSAGQCIAPQKCQAQTANGGGLTDIAQLLQGIKGLMDAMKPAPGGGGGAGAGGCTNYTPTSTPSSDPCSYYVPASDSLNTSGSISTGGITGSGDNGSAAASSLISSLFGSSNPVNSNTNTTDTTGTTNTNTNTNTSNTTPTPTQSSNLNPGTNAATSQAVFGSSPGIAGDVQIITGNQVTVLASNRDVANGRQTTGFYGYGTPAGQAPQSIYTNLCASRPWATNFLSFIMPSNYLDSLCSSHGFAVGMPTPTVQVTQSSSGSIVPKSTPVASSTPLYIGVLRADIWAVPPAVTSGARTSVFWDSNGALSCAVTSNDSAFTGSSLSGHASSQPLTKNTTFSISCQNATSTVSNQVVVTVQ